MYKSITCLILFLIFFSLQEVCAQEISNKESELVQKRKDRIIQEEKSLLRIEVLDINDRLKKNKISEEEAIELKETAAKKRALNIKDRISILDSQIAVFDRNSLDSLQFVEKYSMDYDMKESYSWLKNSVIRAMGEGAITTKEVQYDRRTYSNLVFAYGFNQAIVEGESFKSNPYNKVSLFSELGWSWRTRLLKESNFFRFNYGFSFQFNSLELSGNNYLVLMDGKTEIQRFENDLRKSAKIRRTNLVVPMYLEFGPSKVSKTENSIRYSLKNQFRFGFGGFAGVNLNTRQKLEYDQNGGNVKIKIDNRYNTNSWVYGVGAYAGFDGLLLYVKYNLNPIFKDSELKQQNISAGFRFDL